MSNTASSWRRLCPAFMAAASVSGPVFGATLSGQDHGKPDPVHCDAPAATGRSNSSSLRILDIALGQNTTACKPERKVYRETARSGGTALLECTIGDAHDTTRLTFSADQQRVVRVVRTQYFGSAEIRNAAILTQAAKHYGKPDASDATAEVLLYGNAFNLTHNAGSTQINRSTCGSGLMVRGQACGDGTFGLEDCRGLGVRFIRYELVDNNEWIQAIQTGRRQVQETERRFSQSMKF